MKVELKGDETLFAGNVVVVVPAGTVIEFPNAENFDQLAGELAAQPALYAQFRDDLMHKEKVRRFVDGEKKDVVVGVVYVVGGQRNELAEEAFDKLVGEMERSRAAHAPEAETSAPDEGGEGSNAPAAQNQNEPPVPSGQPELAPPNALDTINARMKAEADEDKRKAEESAD